MVERWDDHRSSFGSRDAILDLGCILVLGCLFTEVEVNGKRVEL